MTEFTNTEDTPDKEDDPGCGREVRKRYHARKTGRDSRSMNPYR